MQVNADHETLVNYLRQLEEFSQFIRISNIDITKKEEISGPELNVLMVLSALLGEERVDASRRAQRGVVFGGEKRDPFHLGGLVAAQFSEGSDKYTLQGAITGGKRPTAVINDTVYNLGDKVDGSVVEEISSDRVVLKEGQKIIVLTLDED